MPSSAKRRGGYRCEIMEGFFPTPKSFFLVEAQRGISPHRVENNASPAATAWIGKRRKTILRNHCRARRKKAVEKFRQSP